MPGILPMKVIKVGAGAQSRIAQACDRCRSKKIRCDGMRPCCSQCATVGFECKTSDKLSRRAFPRGYTESLEERVRVLEAEVRELKDLLDEKDEKIDMLSRIHSHSSIPIQPQTSRRPSTLPAGTSGHQDDTPTKDEVFKVQQSPDLFTGEEGSDSYFAGTSSARAFVEAFRQRVQESDRSTTEIDTAALLNGSLRKSPDAPATPSSPVVWKSPPRLISDQLINIYFQEWAPLFPILHRPTFLKVYERYIGDSDSVIDKAEIAQLNLVFGIASLSSGSRSSADLDSFEVQWKAALDSIMAETSTSNLQALALAQLFCIQQGDYARLLTFKGLATTMSTRLGLHQSQKHFALNTLTCETRKKLFWTLYTIDSFTAAILGLPKHLKDDDVQCEYPVDADDEYVSERGFLPTLPGESTKLSSALALFRASRILSKVLEEVFPARASYDLTLSKLSQLSDELHAWSNGLPPHLRLQFAQDKPSTGTVSSRSPLISLTYHYIRALIYRPPICASTKDHSSPLMITVASACKHMIQIIELLDERGLSFSFCLNRDEVLVVSGLGLLLQGLTLDPGSKILRDNEKMTNAVSHILSRSGAPCASAFGRIATSKTLSRRDYDKPRMPSTSRHNSGELLTRKPLKVIASRLTGKTSADSNRRATIADVQDLHHCPQVPGQPVPESSYNPASISRSEPARSPVNLYSRPTSTTTRISAPPPHNRLNVPSDDPRLPNLDYLSFGNEPESTGSPLQPVKTEPAPTEWEKLLGSLDNGKTNIYDACYGGPPVDALLDAPSLGMQSSPSSATLNSSNPTLSADTWVLYQTDTNASADSALMSNGAPDSILSFSTDESLSSGDELPAEWASASSSGGGEQFRAIILPELGFEDMKIGNGWEVALSI